MENKYQVIDPDNEEYKLTKKDLKKERKKKNKPIKILVSIVVILALLVGSGAVYIYTYLSKINYGDSQGQINPALEKDEELNFNGKENADKDILANLDNTMWYDDRIYNILLVGVDYGDVDNPTPKQVYLPRSDSMILISINSVKNVINMVSISRAAYVAIPGHGNKRLNSAHAFGGASLLVETIQNNYKIRIDRYITVDISGFKEIVDILGGISINMTAEEARAIFKKAEPGTYSLDGANTVAYARLRSIDSDRKRTGRQRAVLNAIIDKYRHSSVKTMLGLMNNVLPLVTTNFKKTELVGQVTKAPTYFKMSINQDIIPHNAVPLSNRDGTEVLILNWPETTKYVHQLLYPDMTPQSFNKSSKQQTAK